MAAITTPVEVLATTPAKPLLPLHTTTFSVVHLGSELRRYLLVSKTIARFSPVSTAPHAPPFLRFRYSIFHLLMIEMSTSMFGLKVLTTVKFSVVLTISIQLRRMKSCFCSSGLRWLVMVIPPTMLGTNKNRNFFLTLDSICGKESS